MEGIRSMNPKNSREGTPARWIGSGGAVLAASPQPSLLIDSTLVTESYSHPCDTQHVLLLAAAGWIQPQGPSSSRAGSCLLPRGIFGNESCIPSSFPLRAEGRCVELLATGAATHRTAKEKTWHQETLQKAPKCKITTSGTGFIHHSSSWQRARAGGHDRGQTRALQCAARDTETQMLLQ